jgi:hypothetical protein
VAPEVGSARRPSDYETDAKACTSLRDAEVRVLHDQPLPFPLGNWRAEFVAGLRQALT